MSKRYTEEQNRQWQAGLPKKKVAVKVILKSDKGNILLVKPDYKDTWQMPAVALKNLKTLRYPSTYRFHP